MKSKKATNEDREIVENNLRLGVVAINFNSRHQGIGAKLEWALEVMAFCDEYSLTPQFRFSYPNSSRKENYFEMFFGINGPPNLERVVDFLNIGHINELGLGKGYDSILDMELATRLLSKYLFIKDDIVNEIDQFCARNFRDKSVLGIHYRGTDKVSEAPRVSYESVLRNIDVYIDRFPITNCLFVSSDDGNFIDFLANARLDCTIAIRNDSVRSFDGAPIHHSNNDRANINRDAVVNCLLLSRCDGLMKTASILSGWSMLFNPKMPLIMLNEPYSGCQWFPERELIKNVVYKAVQ